MQLLNEMKLIIKILLSFIYRIKIILKINNLCYKCNISNRSDFNLDSINNIKLGKNITIGAYSTITVINDIGENNSELHIDSGVYIGEYNNIRACGGIIKIGEDSLISQHITMVAANHKFDKSEKIKKQPWSKKNNFIHIGSDVWIGSHVVILPGVTIGNGVVIGAGSVVSIDLEEYSIYRGNPIKKIGVRR